MNRAKNINPVRVMMSVSDLSTSHVSSVNRRSVAGLCILAMLSILVLFSQSAVAGLTGTLVAPPSTLDLSGEGATDWAHWGLSGAGSFDHSSTGGGLISDVTLIGSAGSFGDAPVSYAWSDGTPTISSTGTTTGIYVKGIGNGYELTVPADTTLRTLRMYVGVAGARARIEASLSDGSAPVYTDVFENISGATAQLVTLDYSAASAGQTMTFRVTVEASYISWGNVNLQSAMLFGASVNKAPVLDPIGARFVDEGTTLNFVVSASDLDGTIPSLSVLNLPGTATFTDNLDGTGTFNWDTSIGDDGSYPIQFIASDGDLSDSEDIAITVSVSGSNPPVLDPIGNRFTEEGASLNFEVTASDPDGTIPTLSAINLPGTATFIDNLDGTGTFNWDTSIGDNGSYAGISFMASDSVLTDSESITVNISIASTGILVVAPHPDDDIIIAAGVIRAALLRGEDITIVYMTNGDKVSGAIQGEIRQQEAVNSELLLGLNENQLIFLGYPDGYLQDIYSNYSSAADQFVSPHGIAETYANHGLGLQDYHTYRFGSPGAYNAHNIHSDLQDILLTVRPSHIYTLAEFDHHTDHSATYTFISEALLSANQVDNTYVPTLHKSIVHSVNETVWPQASAPQVYYTPIPEIDQIPELWSERISIDVPNEMQIADLTINLKQRALEAHSTQFSNGYIGRFLHKDEFFWVENLINADQPPHVSAGNDFLANPGDFVQLNGTGSYDLDSVNLTYQWSQVGGVSVVLDNLNSSTPAFTVPTNLLQTTVFEFELTVSDEQFTSVADRVLVTVNAGSSQLSGTLIAPPSAVDLSGEGATDWAHWGLSGAGSFDHSSTGGGLISDVTLIGSAGSFGDAPVSYAWSDGTPTFSNIGTTTGIYVKGVNNGYEITVPADTTLRTLRMYVGVAGARARITASLSDGSAVAYTDVFEDISAASAQLVTLDYSAASAGQTMTFRVTVEASYISWGNVNLQSAMLFGATVNKAPVLDPIGDRLVDEGTTLNFVVSASDLDGTIPSLSVLNLPGTATFTDNLDGTGTFNWDTSIGDTGSYAGISIIASDGELTDSEDITVTVSTDVNDPPVLNLIGNQVVEEGTTLNFVVSASDLDGTIPSLSALNLPGTATFTDNLDGTGTFSWDTSIGDSGSYAGISIIASDGELTDSEDITVTVSTDVNDPPVLNLIGNQVAEEGTTLNFVVSASDLDGTIPSLSALNLPDTATFIDNLDGTGTFNWDTGIGDDGSYPIQFIASDGDLSDSEEISVTVSISGSSQLNGSLVAPPSAVDLSGEGVTDWAHWGLSGASSFDHSSIGGSQISDFTQVGSRAARSFGDAPVSYAWNDGTPTVSSVGTTTGVYVKGLNNGYEITVPADATLRTLRMYVGVAGARARIEASLSDGSAPVYTEVFENVSGATTQLVTLDYNAASAGQALTFRVTVEASYISWGNVTLQSAMLFGPDVGNPPVLDPIGSRITEEGTSLNFLVTASDPDGAIPALSAINLPGAATFIDNLDGSGTFNWDTGIGDNGSYPGIQFIASDGDLTDSEEISVTVSVSGSNPPVLDPIGSRITEEGTSLNFLVTASDPDGTIPTLSAINLPGAATFIDNLDGSGTFNWDTGIGDDGSYLIQFIASDGDLSDSEEITVTVSASGSSLLSGSLVAPPSVVDLSGEGVTDWAHWGLSGASSFDHSSIGGSQISDFTQVGSRAARSFGDASVSYAWSDGTPTVSSGGTTTGVYVKGLNNGYEITVPADATLRTLRMYVGVAGARARIEASLSDGSAPVYTEVFENVSGATTQLVTLDYNAASAGQALTFRVTVDASYISWGNVTLQSAMLFGPDVGNPPVVVELPFSDDFSGENLDGWTIVDDSGIASNWQISGGALTQSVLVESLASFDQSYHLGTNIHYTDSLGFSNYSFSVDASQLGPRFEDIGILFRYQDRSNYYRFTMNPRYGFSRLEKKVNGVFTTLAANARGLIPAGTKVVITATVQGSQIHIILNGDPLFAVDDSSLPTGAIGLYSQSSAVFDNVLVDDVSNAPAITLSSPVAYTVDTDNTVDAAALAINVPAGGYVEFSLDDGIPVVDNTEPYEAQFTGVSQGNHKLDAVLRDVDDVEKSRDTNVMIGASGNYSIAIGDSIANGVGDNYSTDNASTSGRVLGIQGYEAVLTDLLDSNEAILPHIVVNEGVGADETSDTLNRIDSILARHSGINRATILLGTNDSGGSLPVLSGSGCSGASCDGTFKGDMQVLIDALPVGTTASVALIPPAFGSSSTALPYTDPLSSSRNNTIQQYNAVITGELSNIQVGPDLFTAFLTSGVNLFSLFQDSLHPNALGHVLIAHLWHNKLNPGNLVEMPFILDNMTPSTVAPYLKQNLLEAGNSYYVDEGFTLTTIPSELDDGVWVMTANADRVDASATYVAFDVDRSVILYIAYDAGASAIPDWLKPENGFTATGLTLTVDGDVSTSTFSLYSKAYSAGSITDLGGNLSVGASGADSNYLVIVKPIL